MHYCASVSLSTFACLVYPTENIMLYLTKKTTKNCNYVNFSFLLTCYLLKYYYKTLTTNTLFVLHETHQFALFKHLFVQQIYVFADKRCLVPSMIHCTVCHIIIIIQFFTLTKFAFGVNFNFSYLSNLCPIIIWYFTIGVNKSAICWLNKWMFMEMFGPAKHYNIIQMGCFILMIFRLF